MGKKRRKDYQLGLEVLRPEQQAGALYTTRTFRNPHPNSSYYVSENPSPQPCVIYNQTSSPDGERKTLTLREREERAGEDADLCENPNRQDHHP